jgi:hypothetical protein
VLDRPEGSEFSGYRASHTKTRGRQGTIMYVFLRLYTADNAVTEAFLSLSEARPRHCVGVERRKNTTRIVNDPSVCSDSRNDES